MKAFKRVTGSAAALALLFSLVGPMVASAATTPSLGAAASYAILSSTYSNTSAATTVNGDIGFTTGNGPAVTPAGSHPTFGQGGSYSQAGTDQAAALVDLNGQPCTFTFAPGAIDLSTDITHGPIGVYAPGVYCSTGAMNIGGPLSLTGSGTYIFRPAGALTSTTGSNVSLNGASVCDVFWTPTAATSLADVSTFNGTIIQPNSSAITLGANTVLTGRLLAFGGTVTTGDTDTINAPSCSTPTPPSGGGGNSGRITVVKRVINDNGRSNVIADFQLFVNGTPVASGVSNDFPAPAGVYTVTETTNPNYTRTFSGDCDANGQLNLNNGDIRICIVTNDDIGPAVVVPPVPPLIDVVKVPSPLALPGGPGPVTYTYSVRNIGTVLMTNVTMVGDSCSPISLQSGDTDSDAQLDVTETWVYTCSTSLTATHTNTVVATGWANGLSASDIASATVVVGAPLVPPLIHVTKVPSPLTLLAGGGMVTYTERITNPGTVALNNVQLTDDTCAPMVRISGDTDGDGQLDTSETWTYTCSVNVTRTTPNTAVATGEANGFIVRDFAIATVVVAAAVPVLPNTGLAPAARIPAWGIAAALFAAALLLYAFRKKKNV